MRNVSDIGCTENKNTHFLFKNVLFFSKIRAVYESMCKNMVQPDRPQMTMECEACALHVE